MNLTGSTMVVDAATGFLEPSKQYAEIGFTADKKKLALEMLREKLNPGAVCKALGINRQHFYLSMKVDPEFAKAYQDVKQAHLDDIAATMYDRAKTPNGTVAGIFLLKTQRPNEYQDKTIVEHTHKKPVDQLFSSLEAEGRLVTIESAKIEEGSADN